MIARFLKEKKLTVIVDEGSNDNAGMEELMRLELKFK